MRFLCWFKNFYLGQALLAIVFAVGVFFSLNPFNFWPAGFLALFAFFCAAKLQENKKIWQIILVSFLFALSLAIITFGWITPAIHRYTGENYFLTLLLVFFFAVFFQTKPLLFFIVKRLFFPVLNFSFVEILALSGLFAITDAFSLELFAWSWGNTISGNAWLRQWAQVGSVYLLGFIASILTLYLLQFFYTFKKGYRPLFQKSKVGWILAFFFLTVGFLFYQFPLNTDKGKLKTLLVQTNIGMAHEVKRNDKAFATEAINRLFNQSVEGELLHTNLDLILWAEGSMPFHAARNTPENASIYSPSFDGVLEYLSRRTGVTVLYQAMEYQKGKLFSALMSRPEADRIYLKRRLVPWGEYLPFEKNFPSVRKIFPEAGKFSPATKKNVLEITLSHEGSLLPNSQILKNDLPLLSTPEKIKEKYAEKMRTRNLTITPLLCYEALFPQDAVGLESDLIVNLSNDTWFMDGFAGLEHAGAVSLRAVENGVPFARAALSGVSYAVDNRGEYIAPPTGQGTVETAYVEIPLQKRFTLFSWGKMPLFYFLMLCALAPYFIKKLRSLVTKNVNRRTF
ncbi:MAG: Apolipoprotein N-acyltransferase [Turneriella sp.]|nr:Apolipoprotein N-acyltransferase [Turneriella sp.]